MDSDRPNVLVATSAGDAFLARNATLLRRLAQWCITLSVIAVTFVALLVLHHVINTLIVLIFTVLFCYAIYPAVRRLVDRGVPIAIAVTLVYAGLFVVILGALAWLAPTLISQGGDLAQHYPRIVAEVQRDIADPSRNPLLQKLPDSLRSALATNMGKAGTVLGGVAGGFGGGALALLSSTTALLIDTTLVLGLASLILSELDDITTFCLRPVPLQHRPAALSLLADLDKVVGGFVRGQLVLAVIIAIVASIVLLIAGVPYAVLLAILTSIINIVPLIGALIALIPLALIAFITVGWVKALIVVVILFVVFQLQQQLLNPRLVSQSVGVTPFVFFLALLLGSEAGGILGALLSVPIAGILRVVADRLFPQAASVSEA